jgi:large subunit ribosomal protein L24e
MVERRVCTFCGGEIEPGTGRMYIKKDGAVFQFCTSKCFKNMVELGRVPRRTTWTRHYEREKGVRVKGVPEEPKKRKAKKVKAPSAEEKEEEASAGEEEAAAEETEEPEAAEEAPKKKPAAKKKRATKGKQEDDE